MILIIDNYDSFVYNLARYIARLGEKYIVKRNDEITVEQIKQTSPRAIIISPGPCSPKEAGLSKEIIKEFAPNTPILGVCLGHQAIGEVYGCETIRAQKPIHGKRSLITHQNTPLFENIPTPFSVGRYHSLIIDETQAKTEQCPLLITAQSETDEIMAVEHKEHPVYGVQFHPESVLTPHGNEIIKNFLNIVEKWHNNHN